MILKFVNRKKTRRRGFVTAKTLIGLASGGVVVVGWWLMTAGESEEALPDALFEQVVRKEFRLEIVEPGELDPDAIHLPGIYVHRLVQGEFEKRIEQRTVRKKESA